MAGIFKRLRNVITAEAHDLLDSHEAPDRIARQLVRETSDKVTAAQKFTIDAVASEKQLALQLKSHSEQVDKDQKSAEAAIKSGDETRARRALESKKHNQKIVDTLIPQLDLAKSNSESLKKQLVALQQQLSSLKSEQSAIEARFKGAKATGKIEEMKASFDLGDDVQSRLQMATSMVTNMEAHNEAVAEVKEETSSNSGNDSTTDLDIDLELEKLRKIC